MDAQLGMSLDDLILKNRTSRTVKDGKGSGARRSTARKPGAEGLTISVDASAGVRKDRPIPRKTINKQNGWGGGTSSDADRTPAPTQAQVLREQQQRQAAVHGGASWRHDKFDDDRDRQPARRAPMAAARPMPMRSQLPQVEPQPRAAPLASRVFPLTQLASSTKLFLSNLHPDVVEGDVKELFEKFGPLKAHTILYDRSGRSEGKAEVTFHAAEDAAAAKQNYEGLELDGQPMEIKFWTPSDDAGVGPAPLTQLSSGRKVSMRAAGPDMGQRLSRGRGAALGGQRMRMDME